MIIMAIAMTGVISDRGRRELLIDGEDSGYEAERRLVESVGHGNGTETEEKGVRRYGDAYKIKICESVEKILHWIITFTSDSTPRAS